jgi:DNA-binding winged helix-turn-helix (wHTH) protein
VIHLRVLAVLVRRRDEIVTREELVQLLRPSGTSRELMMIENLH